MRLLSATVSIAITFALFHNVASLARPTAVEQLAQATKATVTIATAQALPQRP
jgi:hypothetical protein